MSTPTDLPGNKPFPRTKRDLLAVHYTNLINELWPDILPSERRRLRRQTTEEGLKMAIADINMKHHR